MKRIFSILTAFAMAAAVSGVLRADDQMTTAAVIEKNGTATVMMMQQGMPQAGQTKASPLHEFTETVPQPPVKMMPEKERAAAVPQKMPE